MRRSGVRIPLAPPQADIRSGCRFFVCLGVVAVVRCAAGVPGAACALLGRAAQCAHGRRPAREPSAQRASLGASSRSPAWPCRHPRAPRPGPAAHGHHSLTPPPPTGTAVGPCHRPPVPRPGPAAAHEHRSLALRSLRRPPHWRHLACWCVADRAPSPPTGAAAWTRRRPSTRGQGFRLDCNSCFQRGTCEPCV